MWAGPYGSGGSRKHVLASLDQSLRRLGVEYVDVFYSHRFDPAVPLDETMAALATAVDQGKALYAGISSYSAGRTREAATLLAGIGTPLTLHQPSYSLLNRWIEGGLLDTLEEVGAGCIVFSPLAQGLLSGKYLDGVPAGSRGERGGPFRPSMLSAETLEKVRQLAAIAARRGQSLAQMAIAWTLRHPAVTSALVGASSVEQLEENLGALANLDFSDEELAEIDRYATEADLNIWDRSSTS
jgi:L-glyceraldehyde 3-phosphate reductase